MERRTISMSFLSGEILVVSDLPEQVKVAELCALLSELRPLESGDYQLSDADQLLQYDYVLPATADVIYATVMPPLRPNAFVHWLGEDVCECGQIVTKGMRGVIVGGAGNEWTVKFPRTCVITGVCRTSFARLTMPEVWTVLVAAEADLSVNSNKDMYVDNLRQAVAAAEAAGIADVELNKFCARLSEQQAQLDAQRHEIVNHVGMPYIGVFDNNMGCPGAEYLSSVEAKVLASEASAEAVHALVTMCGGKPDARFEVLPPFMSHDACAALIRHLDTAALDHKEEDLKLTLTRGQLEALIGPVLVCEFMGCFGLCNKIRLRRCEAHGKFIEMHIDKFAQRTMQVPLNESYEGGELVYASGGQFHWPARPAGSATIHDSTIVHGVTALRSGIRYGLYFLQE